MAASKAPQVTLDQRFAEAMGQLLGPDFPSEIALAVSGGGDSMAMLALAHNWTRIWGVKLWVVTVDHGLRPESAAEAAMVAEECALLGHPHATLRWHWDGTGNKMDAARRARLDLIDAWRGGIAHVLMAHTQDDLAETFLMRLKRGSGTDGLAAMSARRSLSSTDLALPAFDCDGARPEGARCIVWQVLRPCLGMARAELRHYLTVLKTRWIDDPSNDDPSYERIQMRQLFELLEGSGIARAGLAETAQRLAQDRMALRARAAQIWQSFGAQTAWGGLSFAPGWHETVEVSTQRRLLNAALRYIAMAEYGPRAEALDGLRDRLVSGGTGTLHGCDTCVQKGHLLMFREYAAVRDVQGVVGQTALWDNRWRIYAPQFKGLSIRALGDDGWRQAKTSHTEGPPYRAALSLPSIWQGDRLVACDALGVGPGQTTTLAPQGQTDLGFKAFLLSH